MKKTGLIIGCLGIAAGGVAWFLLRRPKQVSQSPAPESVVNKPPGDTMIRSIMHKSKEAAIGKQV